MMRPLDPAERMTDRFDLASTLSFTTVASVRGKLQEAQLHHALRCLERRHPQLRAALVRDGDQISIALGRAAEIPLCVLQAPLERVLELAAASIDHRVWSDAGPRAELTWLQHSQSHSTLLLCQHHVVSDGSSGILAMRDLLAFLTSPDLQSIEPVPSPGQEAFFPESHAETRAAFQREAKTTGGAGPKSEPVVRLARFGDEPFEARRVALRRIHLSASESSALIAHARADGATVHGVLCAAFAQSIAQEQPKPARQRWSHPVDLRRYLRALEPNRPGIGDAVGYYVSAIATEHPVEQASQLGPLASAITQAVRAAKQAGEPLTSAPLRGPHLVELTRSMPLDIFRTLAEQKIFSNTASITNLGPLEPLGVTPTLADDRTLEDLYFVSASSVMGQLSGSAVSYAGRISLQLAAVTPLISAAVLDRLTIATAHRLHTYAQATS